MSQETSYTVTELTRELKKLVRNSYGTFWLEGELSGYKAHTSGHHYFTMKDSGAQIQCAMWKANASKIGFRPADGIKVQAYGSLDVYEPRGQYQFIVALLRPSGAGELQRAFEELKQKLQLEGLFESARKRPLPKFPDAIGIVTSPTGAALQDMLSIAARRWPATRLILSPARVQGAGAAEEIASGIAAFNRSGDAEILIVGRGGGSLEDLWAFNEEVVARAIFQSRIPVVSAVGHEVDFTIADFVADLRAPTPSAAIELVLPDRTDIARHVDQLKRRMAVKVLTDIRTSRHRVTALTQHWALREPVYALRGLGQRLDDLQSRLVESIHREIDQRRVALDRVGELLTLFRPQAILTRGYAIVQDGNGHVIRDASMVGVGSGISVTLAKGHVEAQVTRIDPEHPQ